MNVEELVRVAQQLQDHQQNQQEMRLLLMTLQQAIADMLSQMGKQTSAMTDAVRTGLSGLKIPSPQVSVSPNLVAPPERKRCAYVVQALRYDKQDRNQQFKIVPEYQ